MRLSSTAPRATRQQRLDRLRRDRAAALTLRAAFPAVEQLRLEFSFEGAAPGTPAAQSHVLHPPARAFFEFPCPFANCDGLFDLGAVVNTVLSGAADRLAGSLECGGLRARDHASKQTCGLRLNYVVSALYQPEP